MKTPGRTAAIAACLALSLPAAAAAQETTAAEHVRAVIADARDGTLDDVPMTSEFAKRARNKKHRARHAKNFKRFGELENVTFWETFDDVDLYLAAFEHARVAIVLARNDAGEFTYFRYRSVRVAN